MQLLTDQVERTDQIEFYLPNPNPNPYTNPNNVIGAKFDLVRSFYLSPLGLSRGLIVQSTVNILEKKWGLALGHSLRKRYFGPAITTLMLGLGVRLGWHSSH